MLPFHVYKQQLVNSQQRDDHEYKYGCSLTTYYRIKLKTLQTFSEIFEQV